MIIGATQETGYQIMAVSEALYNQFDLKRVFYSAFINVNQDAVDGRIFGDDAFGHRAMRAAQAIVDDFHQRAFSGLRISGYDVDTRLQRDNTARIILSKQYNGF